MNFKTLFSRKKETQFESPIARQKVYSVGYEIHTVDGAIKRNVFTEVLETNLQSYADRVQADISTMHGQLEQAAKKKQTFVEIESNVYRVADVKSITYIQVIN